MTGYIGVSGVARKIDKIYIGVSGVARQVKKAYVGVGGVGWLWYSIFRNIKYAGAGASLGLARKALAGGTVGDYALFAGGIYTSGAFLTNMDSYDNTLTHNGTFPARIYAAAYLTACRCGDRLFFAGGNTADGAQNRVYGYDTTLTRNNEPSLSAVRQKLASAVAGDYALFAGGTTNGTTYSDVVDAYDSSFTHTVATSLRSGFGRYSMGAGTIGGRAFFIGGQISGGVTNQVDVYTPTLTRSNAGAGINAKNLGCATVGNYLVCAGGNRSASGYTLTNAAYAYNPLGTLVSPLATLDTARTELAAAAIGNYAIFAGGCTSASAGSTAVDAYDDTLTKVFVPDSADEQAALSVARGQMAAAATGNGEFAVFVGGGTDDSNVNNVATADVFMLD